MPICENCIHTIKDKSRQDAVVCVPYLKTMPADNASVCELHSMKNKKS